MIAETYSNGALNEMGYCDFGYPNHHALGHHRRQLDDDATFPQPSGKQLDLRSSKLDRVVRSFAKVYDGRRIDTELLLEACRALLDLIRGAGSAALRLASRDLESNLRKVEASFNDAPHEGRCLSSLLESEKVRGLHDGNELREDSAAMGLLWIRRSLAFQSHMYYHSLVLSRGRGKHPRDAASESYDRHLSPYHGWMLRTVFPASFSQMPGREVFLSKFGEMEMDELDDEREAAVANKLGAFIETLDPLLDAWRGEFDRLGLEDTRRV